MENEVNSYLLIKEAFDLPDVKPNELAPLILAHIGDAVYEVVIRTIELSKGNRAIVKVHSDSIKLVNAKTQAELADKILPILSPEEEAQYRRGRNAKAATHAKNASVSDYRKATGVEALIGYLYLLGRTDRIFQLLSFLPLEGKVVAKLPDEV